MKYTGRVTGVLFVVLAIITARIYAYIHFNYSLSHPPIIGIIFLLIVYRMGKEYDKVKFYSEKDSLTGLYNRRFLNEILPILLAQMQRKNEKLSLCILDCDNFKIINDTQGHKKGDIVLKEISDLLVASIRKSDVAVRLGGDEFLVIAPYADEEDMQIIMNRFKIGLQELSSRLKLDVSMSSGVATYPTDAETIDDLIEFADSKMYSLKKIVK